MQIIAGLSIAFGLVLIGLFITTRSLKLCHGSFSQMLLGYPMLFGGLSVMMAAIFVLGGSYEKLAVISGF